VSLLHRIKEEAIRVKTIMPRYLQLEISKECNLKCVGCYRGDNTSTVDLKGERNLTLSKLQEIIDMIPTVKTVTFLGDGEPLMNKNLSSILRYLVSRKINSWLTTNGTLITQEMVDEWEECRVTEVHISLDSMHKDMYEKMRVGASFEKVMEAVKVVGRSKVPLFINFLAYQETINDLPDIIRLLVDNNGKGINMLFPIFLLGSDLKGELTRPKNDKLNRTYIQKATKIAGDNGITWIGGEPSLSPSFRHCNLPFALPYITLGGDVYGCCYAVGVGRTEWYQGVPQKIESSDYLMGNIYDSSFKDIWLGETYKELRRAVKLFERPRGTEITPEELQKLRYTNTKNRFSYCKSCLWRWGSAC